MQLQTTSRGEFILLKCPEAAKRVLRGISHSCKSQLTLNNLLYGIQWCNKQDISAYCEFYHKRLAAVSACFI
jgi:hypothetical protein